MRRCTINSSLSSLQIVSSSSSSSFSSGGYSLLIHCAVVVVVVDFPLIYCHGDLLCNISGNATIYCVFYGGRHFITASPCSVAFIFIRQLFH